METEADRGQDAHTAAHLYYVQHQTMEAIARELHTSRSTVSRLLSHARETGIVDIRVRSPRAASRRIEAEIQERFRLTAHVAPVPQVVSEADRLERVAATAAGLLGDFVDSNQIIGVAWGSTMAAMSRHLVPRPTQNTVVVQLNGSGNTQTSGLLYASEILQRFAAAFDARVEQFPVPAFFDHAQTRSAVWRERSTRRLLDLQRSMNLVVFSVGAADAGVPSHVYSGGYLDAADLAALRRDGVAGDVATVFYRADGSSTGIVMNERSTGPTFATLRRTPRRLCVVAGEAKVAALRGAIAADLVTDLVVDEPTAHALLRAA
ncbi:MAG: helix-turn-helix domain-containing protein [Microbacterium sp.]|uniref:sugar-binding transcriptional regulator n=1 Tax=Microbacterium sp. TaxID=51671 RepID=UPI00092AF1A0|nr:sugar-binding domain-containing protein [Microbacterium sp.]MBN9168497.1 helix-turn-helix domain-containing protein [Microbacterium sp.]MBN9175590.1 helix-turn-helix domain-containing protein [Microbacterium sp.]MBN9192893.1 helix-turn-helix domain-containing protein [Microbacterium sp.]OJU69174.1 MAG: transcriptional regulator [Microbacterium sp. 70-38]